MLNFLNTLDRKVRDDFSFIDLSLIKLYAFIPGLVFGAFFPHSIKKILWILVITFIILFARYFYLLFVKEPVIQDPTI